MKHVPQGLKPPIFLGECFRGFENPLPRTEVRGFHPSTVTPKANSNDHGSCRLWSAPFNDGCAVASMNLSSEDEVILLTSKGPPMIGVLTQTLKPVAFLLFSARLKVVP
jgi:hypothetical protein